MVIIDELDNAKTNTMKLENSEERVRTRARRTLRELEERFGSAGAFTVSGEVPTIEVTLVTEDPRHVRLPHADSELVDVARALKDFSGVPSILVSSDTGIRLRARAAGLEAAAPPESN